ncbi:MAG TPA: hypothetical protein ENN46_02565 [Candidatus Woesearchaeota archaeon]|nr:hypothetical protein [Candidatus Woesearchaeota archaeon]
MKEKKPVKKEKKSRLPLLFSVFLAAVVVFFFLIVGFSVHKSVPELGEKPSWNETSRMVSLDATTYLLNKLHFYRLNSRPFSTEPALVKIVILDYQQELFASVASDVMQVLDYNPGDNVPDIIIYLESDAFFRLYQEPDNRDLVRVMRSQDKILVDKVKDRVTLFLKGYSALAYLY